MLGTGFDAGLSFACAAAAAGGNATANVMQRKASLEQPSERNFGAALLWDLVRRPTWLLGFGAMVASFVLQAVALGLGQLSAVETIITLEVPLTLLVASHVFGVGVGRAEWAGIWTMTLGMIVVVAVLDPHPGNEAEVNHLVYAMAGGGTLVCILLLLAAGQRGRRLWRTACLGAAAGTCFGLAATLIKAVVARLNQRGMPGLLLAWQTYAAITVGVAGVVIVQWALHTGPLLAAQPGFTLMDPLVSTLWGVLVYHETVRGGTWLLPALLGAAAITGGVLLLAHSPLLSALNEDTLQDRATRPGSYRPYPPFSDHAGSDGATGPRWAHH